jgi:3D (Asp-Asp-Asp) domain-containing protein
MLQRNYRKVDRTGPGKLKLTQGYANEFLSRRVMRCIFFKKIVFSYLLAISLVIASTGFVTPPAAGQSNSTESDQIIANSSTQLIRADQSTVEYPVTEETINIDLGPELSRSGSDIAADTASVKPLVKSVKPTYKWMTFVATFYQKDEPGMNGLGITATDTHVKQGRTIAVDPRVIPFGTKVYIEGFGYRIAEDSGGAIKGNRIDIYYDHVSDFPVDGYMTVKLRIVG